MAGITRDQILMHFMECTGIMDFEESMAILEQNGWNLEKAIECFTSTPVEIPQRETVAAAVPKHSKSSSTKPSTTIRHQSIIKRTISNDDQLSNDEDSNNGSSAVRSTTRAIKAHRIVAPMAASGGVGVREVIFKVEYKDKTERIKLKDTDTILQLRRKIFEKFQVPENQQRFTNWESKFSNELNRLKDLPLTPGENTIHLIRAQSSITTTGTTRRSPSLGASRTTKHSTASSHASNITTDNHFSVLVEYEDHDGKKTPYQIHINPTATIHELKKEIQNVSHVPIEDQIWSDLQTNRDTDTLRHAKISARSPLKVRRKSKSPQKTPTRPSRALIKETSPATDDDVMEIDSPQSVIIDQSPTQDVSSGNAYGNNRDLLIPENCKDETDGLENFTRIFHFRFGSTGPILFIGSLQKAIQASFHVPAQERRPLLIYLHNDRAISANVFCTQVLSSDTLIEYLVNHFIVWAWDFTSETNRAQFFNTFKHVAGSRAAQSVSSTEIESYPLMIVLQRGRGSIEISNVIEGSSTLTEVISSLSESYDSFKRQQQLDIDEEIERDQRENLRKQQEAEYEKSLAEDIAKEEAKKNEEKRLRDEQAAKEEKERRHQKEQKDCRQRLPAEPSENEKSLIKFKIRLPDDKVLMRRFRMKETLQTLFDYLSTEACYAGEYKLITTYPKRDLTTLDHDQTFERLELFPQQQLILEFL